MLAWVCATRGRKDLNRRLFQMDRGLTNSITIQNGEPTFFEGKPPLRPRKGITSRSQSGGANWTAPSDRVIPLRADGVWFDGQSVHLSIADFLTGGVLARLEDSPHQLLEAHRLGTGHVVDVADGGGRIDAADDGVGQIGDVDGLPQRVAAHREERPLVEVLQQAADVSVANAP